MSNRLEELESQVTELQAAVNGLTEELVETKERLRLIENNIEIDLSAGSRSVGHESDTDNQPNESAQPQDSGKTHTDTATVEDETSQEMTSASTAETSQNKTEANAASNSDGSDDESSDDSDIIIA
ncbi:MAG: hypothetical protein J07HQW1_00487 [Haloquadratum walsbyi J07HQW1]|jgi:hypothetical protein|uniref:BZIP transcription factor n=1 Tax=Haloquadratum walsbyi J07HQW1 TaxID=1238424 RepID=U1N1W8_9EURY|nr:MAG: hypothetical protein J07HQW1_00487 [Haloquadratum walsbyi J07HQW1]